MGRPTAKHSRRSPLTLAQLSSAPALRLLFATALIERL